MLGCSTGSPGLADGRILHAALATRPIPVLSSARNCRWNTILFPVEWRGNVAGDVDRLVIAGGRRSVNDTRIDLLVALVWLCQFPVHFWCIPFEL